MGRAKRPYPQGRLRLRTDGKTDPHQKYAVVMEYSWNSTPFRKPTGVKCKIADWNDKGNNGKGELRASYGADYRQVNLHLNKQLNVTDERFRTFYEKGERKILNNIDVKSLLEGDDLIRRDKGKDFIAFAMECLESRYKSKTIGYSRYKDGESVIKSFRDFLVHKHLGTINNGEGIYLGEIDKGLIVKFIEWKTEIKRNKIATINHALTHIINTLEEASDNDLIERSVYGQVKKLRMKDERDINEDENVDRFLDETQFKALRQYYNDCALPRRKEYIEMFIFMVYACGMRVVDLMTLRWSDINFERNELTKIQVKTKNRNVIPLDKSALEIINKWREKGNRRFVFDILSEDFELTDANIYKARNSFTQSFNQALKPIGEEIGLPFPLTCHCARHTFAVFALNKSLSHSIVSRLLGHQSTSVTEKVYAKYLPSTLQLEVANLGLGEFGK